jgi:hypothetical protein
MLLFLSEHGKWELAPPPLPGDNVSYRNKTYVAFASEDISRYRMMEAWKANEHIDFNFFDAHDLFISRDTSSRETIKRNLRERLKNAKQVVLLGTTTAKSKGGDGYSFLAHEIDVIIEFNLPIVVANIDSSEAIERKYIPAPLLDKDYYTLSVSWRPKIIVYALDNYAVGYASSTNKGPHYYRRETYQKLGL